MLHSILIPHYEREENLAHCLRSIEESSRETGITNYEIIVAGEMDEVWLARFEASYRRLRFLKTGCLKYGTFCKGKVYNAAFGASSGDVISFIDADAIVGKHWLRGAELLASSSLHRLCYRVMYLEPEELTAGPLKPWKNHVLAYESYGDVYNHDTTFRLPIFGNSQATMKRCDIGELRHDEDYYGRGFEDLEFIRQIWYKFEDVYSAAIMTDEHYAMYHLRHPIPCVFSMDKWAMRNERKYLGQKTIWFVGYSHRDLEKVSNSVRALPWKRQATAYMLFKELDTRRSETLAGDVIVYLDQDYSYATATLVGSNQSFPARCLPTEWDKLLHDAGALPEWAQEDALEESINALLED
jgi:glycosyltransferase involved in cell wall biosynthesis